MRLFQPQEYHPLHPCHHPQHPAEYSLPERRRGPHRPQSLCRFPGSCQFTETTHQKTPRLQTQPLLHGNFHPHRTQLSTSLKRPSFPRRQHLQPTPCLRERCVALIPPRPGQAWPLQRREVKFGQCRSSPALGSWSQRRSDLKHPIADCFDSLNFSRGLKIQ